MRIHLKLLLAGVALGALTACSGSNGNGTVSRGITIAPEEEATRTFAARDTGNVDAGGAISQGETLTARSVSTAGQLLLYGGGDTSLEEAEVAVRRNDAGELTLVVNGVEHAFSPQDRAIGGNGNAYGYEISDDVNDVYVNLSNWTGDLDDLLDFGSGYAEAILSQTNQVPDAPDVRTFSIVGTETRDADLAGLPSATYSGHSAIVVTPDENFGGWEDETQIRSQLVMSADFGAGTISGNLSDITLREVSSGTDTPIAGTIAMNEASFDVNGFAGTLTPDATYAANGAISIDTGSYSGAFYGPVANEVGGAISVTGTRDAAGVNGIGFFHGYQD